MKTYAQIFFFDRTQASSPVESVNYAGPLMTVKGTEEEWNNGTLLQKGTEKMRRKGYRGRLSFSAYMVSEIENEKDVLHLYEEEYRETLVLGQEIYYWLGSYKSVITRFVVGAKYLKHLESSQDPDFDRDMVIVYVMSKSGVGRNNKKTLFVDVFFCGDIVNLSCESYLYADKQAFLTDYQDILNPIAPVKIGYDNAVSDVLVAVGR